MTLPQLTAAEVGAVLRAIERGDITLTVEGATPREVQAGDVVYRASNGWRLVVFCDNWGWDYLDSAQAPDGRAWDYEDGCRRRDGTYFRRSLFPSAYRPTDEVARRCYAWDSPFWHPTRVTP